MKVTIENIYSKHFCRRNFLKSPVLEVGYEVERESNFLEKFL
jgi:hypothetical protein